MKKSVKSTLVLVCICAAVSVMMALTNALTAPIIEKNQSAAANAALLEVMPEGKGFELVDISGMTLPATVVEAYAEQSGGYVFRLATTGYSSGLVIMVGVNADGTVSGATCISSTETLGYEKTFGDSFKGKDATGVAGVDTISGATKTTGAYRSVVADALNAAIILGGGEADLRSPEEKFNDNLKAALSEADEFVKKPIVDETNTIDFIYAAKNGAGYVYVIEDETFVGVDALGNIVTEGVSAENAALALSKAALAATHILVDLTDKGVNENVTSVQINAQGNYVIEINGLGFGYFGDEEHYQPAKYIPIKICAVVSPDGVMLECLTVSHEESGGYGAVCGEESYYGQFDGKTADTYKDVDIVGSPTYSITNSGYLKAISRCFETVAILEGGAKE